MIPKYSTRLDWSDEDGAYIATCPEFPGLSGVDGDDTKALAELRDAIEMAIETLQEDHQPIPEPRKLEEYSGQFRLRLPRSLHAALAQRATDEGVSLNALSCSYLSAAVHANPASPARLVEAQQIAFAIAATENATAGAEEAWVRSGSASTPSAALPRSALQS